MPGITNWRHTSPVSPIDIFCCCCLACRVTLKNYFAECKHQEISNKHTHIYGWNGWMNRFGIQLFMISFSSVQFSLSVMSNSLRPYGLQHARPPCPSPTPGVHPNSCPSSRWCHPAISSSVIPFSSCPQSLPASEPFPMSQLFTWGGQSTGVSALASVLPKNTQDWSPLEWTGWIS